MEQTTYNPNAPKNTLVCTSKTGRHAGQSVWRASLIGKVANNGKYWGTKEFTHRDYTEACNMARAWAADKNIVIHDDRTC